MSSKADEAGAVSPGPSPVRARSIASRLIWLYTIAATVVLCSGMGILYWIVVRHIYEEDNVFLRDKLAALREDLYEAAAPQALNEELKRSGSGDETYWIRVYDPTGRVMAASPNMDEVLPEKAFPAPASAGAATPKAIEYRSASGRFFLLVAETEVVNRQPYAVQIAQDSSNDKQFTQEFAVLLLAVAACGAIASGAIAVGVTKRELRPLQEMARAVERIDAKQLHERVPRLGWPRELQPLAAAFNKMVARLESSFTRLSQFSADLAHEFRTPIGNMRGEAEVVLTRARMPNDYRAVLESSVEEYDRLSGMIDNLLFLARAETADAPIECSLFDARAAVEKIGDFFETALEEQNIKITCLGECEVYAEPILFRRAVSNLVSNAVRVTAPGGTVFISIVTGDTEARIAVIDKGRGIASKHLPHVFDRFYRVDASRHSKGTGLGLALVRSIMQIHQGEASIVSEVGGGTTVTLTFPTRMTPGRKHNGL
jgi:two-component system, OmpR family, heavy metal sensor histidine kinase CusS